MDWLLQQPIIQLGAVGLLILGALVFCRLMYTGRLMPKSTVADLRAVLEKRIEEKTSEAAEWKSAAESATAAARESVAQMGELLKTARTTNTIVETLANQHGGEARDAVAP
jgi:cytoskeletal protein RodZ